ncbi:hypothetical protein C0J45_16666 [Silurus meridionalis]|nr:hypothetical protein C0J45_16666 [Silurus meridionalis]
MAPHNTAYDCVATSNSTTIIKFADNTVVVGLISNNDETVYLQEVKNLERWCQGNNLLLNISKNKELIVHEAGAVIPTAKHQWSGLSPVERVDSFRYLGVHITQDLSWSCHINTLVKKAWQRLYHLRRLRVFPNFLVQEQHHAGQASPPDIPTMDSLLCCIQGNASAP